MSSIGELSDEQLVHRVLECERELVSARFRHSLNTLENTASLKEIRKDIARLHTAARVREMDQGLPKGSLVHHHRSSFGGAAPADEAQAEKGGFLSGIVDRLSGKD